MAESFQIALSDLKEWLQKETAPLVKPLKDKGKSLLNEIENRLDDVRENGDRIFVKSDKEVQKGSPKTLSDTLKRAASRGIDHKRIFRRDTSTGRILPYK